MGKLPGKTEYSGRRRSVTRKSGFKSHPDSTESEYRVESIPAYELPAGDVLAVNFRIRRPPKGAIVGFGGWYFASEKATGSILRGFHDQAKFNLQPSRTSRKGMASRKRAGPEPSFSGILRKQEAS